MSLLMNTKRHHVEARYNGSGVSNTFFLQSESTAIHYEWCIIFTGMQRPLFHSMESRIIFGILV